MKIVYAFLTACAVLVALSPVLVVLYKIIQDSLSKHVCSHGTRIRGAMLRCDCSKIPHLDDGMSCSDCQIASSHGECGFDSTTESMSVAVCYGKWSGPTCDDCNALSQTNHSCTGECKPDYYGRQCDKKCTASVTCSGKGTCTSTGKCECEKGYWTQVLDGTECNGECEASCSGHGTCSHGRCQCDNGYYNTNCSHPCNCGVGGECDQVTGACACFRGFVLNDQIQQCVKDAAVTQTQNLGAGYLARCKDDAVNEEFEEIAPCKSRGRCSADGRACTCDNRFTHRQNRIIPVHAAASNPVPLTSCTDENITIYTDSYTHAVKFTNVDGVDAFVADADGHLHPHEFLVNTNYKSVTLFDDSKVEPLPTKHDAFIVCANNALLCQGIYESGGSFRLIHERCTESHHCSTEVSGGKVYARPPPGSLYRHGCVTATSYTLSKDYVPCRACEEHWGPAPIDDRESEDTCTRLCSKEDNTCNGHGSCDATTFLCNCDTDPPFISGHNQHWDSETNCAKCEENYFNEDDEFKCTVHCTDTSCNQERSRGACDTSDESLRLTVARWEKNDIDQKPCRCVPPFRNDTNCFRMCRPDEQKDCSGNGECSGDGCVCNTGFHGPTCKFECPKFFYETIDESGTKVVRNKTCNDGVCTALTDYVGGDGKKVFTQTPCVNHTQCGCQNRADCDAHQIFCDTRTNNGICSKVGCSCPDTYAGDMCHVSGCPLHEWNVTGRTLKSPCGQTPPQNTNRHCMRGVCILKDPANARGTEAKPATSVNDLQEGVCLCRHSYDPTLKEKFYGKANFTENVCMTHNNRHFYIGGSCSGQCTCDEELYGVCASTTQETCACRQNPDGEPLFYGRTCSTACDGLCKWDETTLKCDSISQGFLSDKCPCYANATCSDKVSSKGCFEDIYPCSRLGTCESGECVCHAMEHGVVSHVSHKLSMQIPRQDVYMAAAHECKFTCPHSNLTAWHELTEYYEKHSLNLTKRGESTEKAIEDQAKIVEEFYAKYTATVCSGHGTCDGPLRTASARGSAANNVMHCQCDANHGGFDCSKSCALDTDTGVLFRSLGYDEGMHVARAAKLFGISVCGAHARCEEMLATGLVDCVPNGVLASNFEFGKSVHFYTQSNLTVAMGRVKLKASINDNRVLDAYRPYFVGQYAECKASHFTSTPLELGQVPSAINKMDTVVGWQYRRTCDAECITDVVTEVARTNTSIAPRPAHCCSVCWADDWEAYPEYGGCKTCTHHGANPSTQCKECLVENAKTDLVSACGGANSHCNACKDDFAYPRTFPTSRVDFDAGTFFPKCVPCLRGVYGEVCSGHGNCITGGASFADDAGLCTCTSGWTGVSCAKPPNPDLTSQCGVKGNLNNGFCECTQGPLGDNFGGLDCKTKHNKINPLPVGRPCLTISPTGDPLECAGRGTCRGGSCDCHSPDFDPSSRCTELKDEVSTRHERLMCLCDEENNGVVCTGITKLAGENPCSQL